MHAPVDKAGREFWDQQWEYRHVPEAVDPRSPGLSSLFSRRMHAFFERAFAGLETHSSSLLEVGCARSPWLPYFAKEFGFAVSGVDYSLVGCEQARAVLAGAGVGGEIVCADLFDPPERLRASFDVVVSLGVVEHFAQTARAIEACASFLAPGGTLITFVPNLVGVVGRFQRRLDRSIYDIHLPLRADELRQAHAAAGLAMVECDYFLSVGFGIMHVSGAGADPRLTAAKRATIRILEGVSVLVWWLEDRTRCLPATRWLSPYIACVARAPVR
ncbi:MAG: hypothetical protein DLM64_09720 [Solirubrobacterales bacterium]|nr:MAG: hypothetical protein DLM64_09720 [Solirubrobacterales bacterium]